MRVLVVALLVGVLTAITTRAQKHAPGAETPEWVARQVEDRNTGRDSRSEMTMRLFDRQGRARERSLVITSVRGNATRGDRVLVHFQSPGDIKGTGLLVWEHPTAEDERFLFLPALGRVRRIAGSEKQESFAGSDLTYEDFGGREIDSYTYVFAPGSPTWTDPAGASHAVWHLESKAKDASVPYPRAISIVRRDNFVAVAADIFNRRNEPEKRYEVKRLQQVDGIWTAMELVMSNTAQKTRTELVVSSAKYNVGLAESDFTRRALEQGIR